MEEANGTLTRTSMAEISEECYYIEWITKARLQGAFGGLQL
jgi:hypothetical protein